MCRSWSNYDSVGAGVSVGAGAITSLKELMEEQVRNARAAWGAEGVG
jgi:hypothetical protein